jgi:pyridoxal phosphate enzyme (YggS family)
MAPTASEVAQRVERVRDRIASAGGDPGKVQLVAVTKGFGVEAVQAALAAGLTDLGENYAQDLVAKAQLLEPAPEVRAMTHGTGAGSPDSPHSPRWHFVGRLQRNKVRKVAPYVALWQSVDRLSLGVEIARRNPGGSILVQVDLTGEPTKGGCPPDELPRLLEGLRGLGLDLRGLMGIGPLGAPEEARPGFRRLRELAETHGFSEVSMGMSHDLEVAVEEGASMVRLGSALFGPRPRTSGVRH